MTDDPPAGRYAGRRILISGAAGYLANNLIQRLSAAACEIVRLVRPGRALGPVPGAARMIDREGDLTQPSVWEESLPGVDVVFHLAAQTSVYTAEKDPPADLRANVLPMAALLQTARASSPSPVVVFASTSTVAGLPESLPVNESHPDRPVTIYDLHKHMAERYLEHGARSHGVPGTTLRLTNVYGPGPRSSSQDRGILNLIIARAAAGETLTIYGEGTPVRDYVHVDDVADAFLRAGLEARRIGPGPFLIGSGQGCTIRDAFQHVADRAALRTGRRPAVVHVEPPQPQSPIEARNFVADCRRFREATGWQARVSLTEGIDRTLEAIS